MSFGHEVAEARDMELVSTRYGPIAQLANREVDGSSPFWPTTSLKSEDKKLTETAASADVSLSFLKGNSKMHLEN